MSNSPGTTEHVGHLLYRWIDPEDAWPEKCDKGELKLEWNWERASIILHLHKEEEFFQNGKRVIPGSTLLVPNPLPYPALETQESPATASDSEV